MRNKKISILVITFIILFTSVSSAKNSNELIVENLIIQRIDALNLYYSGQARKEETIEIINRVTTGDLRDEDIANINLFFQCDIDEIVGYEIRNVDINFEDKDVICAGVSIEWNVEGLEGKEIFTHTYSVIIKNDENLHKIAQFF